ncbi:polymer-forming cytoskeletal protein [Candidatus Poribacteria bacterium]
MALAAMALLFGLTLVAYGSETRSGNVVEISETEVMPGDLSVACKMLRMNGEVRGDLLAGGMYLTVGKAVGGDAMLGGYNLEIPGSVGDDARLVGAHIEIRGTVAGDLVAFGGNVRVLGDVAGDVIASGGNIWISGNVQGCLDAQGGNIVIAGTIGQNAIVTASRLTLSSTALLKGNLAYTSNRNVDIEQGAQIAGELSREPESKAAALWKLTSVLAKHLPEEPQNWKEWKIAFPLWFRILLRVSSFISLLIAGIVILIVYGRQANMVADRIVSSPWKTLGWGLIVLVCVPIVALILCVSIVGLPAGIVAIATYLVFSYVSRVYVALAIGREILDRITKQDVRIIWPLIVGLLIITILSSIPFYIGWVVRIICVLFGLGGMLIMEKRVRVAPRNEVV